MIDSMMKEQTKIIIERVYKNVGADDPPQDGPIDSLKAGQCVHVCPA